MADMLVGNAAIISGVFTQGGVPTDPGAGPTFTLTDPAGIVTTPTPTHGGTGSYSVTNYCGVAGTWECVISVAYPSAGFGAAKIEWTVAPD